MRDLLFLTHRIPYPPDKGDKIRAWHILQPSRAHSHRMHLGCFIDDPADSAASAGAARASAPTSRAFRCDRRAQRLQGAAAAARRASRCRSAISTTGGSRAGSTRKLADPRDRPASSSSPPPWRPMCMHARGRAAHSRHGGCRFRRNGPPTPRTARLPTRLIWAREGRTLLAFERARPPHFDHTLFVSEQEWQRFVDAGAGGRPPHRLDRERRRSRLLSPRRADYPAPFAAGGAGHRLHRRDGLPAECRRGALVRARRACRRCAALRRAARFCDRRRQPDAGGAATGRTAGVQVTGRVPDMRPYLAHADVVVAPLRIARGIQNKVLEAMAMAARWSPRRRPSRACAPSPGQDILLADGVDETVHEVSEVLDGRHPTLGAARGGGRDARINGPPRCVRWTGCFRRPLARQAPRATWPPPDNQHERTDNPGTAGRGRVWLGVRSVAWGLLAGLLVLGLMFHAEIAAAVWVWIEFDRLQPLLPGAADRAYLVWDRRDFAARADRCTRCPGCPRRVAARRRSGWPPSGSASWRGGSSSR